MEFAGIVRAVSSPEYMLLKCLIPFSWLRLELSRLGGVQEAALSIGLIS